jgi:hypothetical protein
MTDQKAAEDLAGLRRLGADEYAGSPEWDDSDPPIDEWDGDEWDGDEWDGDEWDGYAAAPRSTAAPRASRPWYRDPRWLFGLIALAAAALVVATVLLVTGRGSGEIPTAPELTTRTPAVPSGTPRPEPRVPESASPTTTTSASSTSEQSSPVDSPAPEQPAVSLPEVPEAPPAVSPTKSQAGPRINVTRTPMSFSPGQR